MTKVCDEDHRRKIFLRLTKIDMESQLLATPGKIEGIVLQKKVSTGRK
jgi:hypothetical protein